MSLNEPDRQEDDPSPNTSEAGQVIPRPMTVREAGGIGGRTVREKYGRTYYQTIGKKGGEALKASAPPDHYSHLGEQGGQITKETHGTAFYQAIGQKGGRAVKARNTPDYYRQIGKLGGSAPRRARGHAAGLPAQARPPRRSTGRNPSQAIAEEAQRQLARAHLAQLAALPPSTHVSFTQKRPPPGRQSYWYATWLDRETGKPCSLYLGKERPASHPCLDGTCTHPFRRHQPKKPAGRGGPPIGSQPSPESIERMRQAHLGKSSRSRKPAE